MGRPINKRHFGTPDSGLDIRVRFRATGKVEATGWIIKQVGSKRFKCTDGTDTEVCTLADIAETTLTEGDMTISVRDSEDSNATKRVTKITGRRVTVTGGTQLAWDFTGTATGTVEMEEYNTDDFDTDS